MLTNELLNALKAYTENMQNSVTLVLQTGEHEKRQELIEFLEAFTSVSDKLKLEQRTVSSDILRSPLSFMLEVGGIANGIIFSGIPGGHEFNSLVLAVLHSSGTELKLDSSVKSIIAKVDKALNFEVIISLSCHNCPDIVQALNQFALLNPLISCEMIDGGLYPEIITERNVQGVPSVYLDGEIFANGKIDVAQILEKLLAKYPALAKVSGNSESLPEQDVTVIGGGPAGAAAAIYAARKGLQVTMVADRIGGQVKDTMGIENLISVLETTGPELAAALQEHINAYEITVKEHLRVESIENGDLKKVLLSSGEIIQTKTVIIATGAKWRELGIPGEKENVGNGVAYCPHCDGPFFAGKDVAVIGGGNSGIEAALDLAGIVKSVTVYEFMPELKADSVLLEQVKKRANITINKNVATREIIASNGKVSRLEYLDRESEETHSQNLSGVFVQIGLVPNSHFLGDLVELSAHGEIVINERGETSQTGIYACGDVTTVPYKQIVVAMGEGAKAGLSAFEYLLKMS